MTCGGIPVHHLHLVDAVKRPTLFLKSEMACADSIVRADRVDAATELA
jgi:hypothetical protein